MGKLLKSRRWVGNLTRFDALAGGAFDHLISCQHTGEFEQNFSKKVKCPGGFLGGGGDWAVLELTGNKTTKKSRARK